MVEITTKVTKRARLNQFAQEFRQQISIIDYTWETLDNNIIYVSMYLLFFPVTAVSIQLIFKSAAVVACWVTQFKNCIFYQEFMFSRCIIKNGYHNIRWTWLKK